MNDIVSTTMDIKESFFEAHGKEDFQLQTLHLLRHKRTDLLRNNSSSTPTKPAQSLPDTYFTASPVQTSLTLMKEANDVQVAMKMFKNVLGFMGDRQYVLILHLDTTVITLL